MMNEWQIVKTKKNKKFNDATFSCSSIIVRSTNTDGCDLFHISEEIKANSISHIQRLSHVMDSSKWFHNFCRKFEESIISTPKNSLNTEFVCFGLGSFFHSAFTASLNRSRYQLAFLISLMNRYKSSDFITTKESNCHFYDPVFTKYDIELLRYMGFEVISQNENGRRQARSEGYTVFFMPHCPENLYKNVLLTNWGTTLSNVIVVGNSLSAYIDRVANPKTQQFEHFLQILKPFWNERRVDLSADMDNFRLPYLEQSFYGLSIISFPSTTLSELPILDSIT